MRSYCRGFLIRATERKRERGNEGKKERRRQERVGEWEGGREGAKKEGRERDGGERTRGRQARARASASARGAEGGYSRRELLTVHCLYDPSSPRHTPCPDKSRTTCLSWRDPRNQLRRRAIRVVEIHREEEFLYAWQWTRKYRRGVCLLWPHIGYTAPHGLQFWSLLPSKRADLLRGDVLLSFPSRTLNSRLLSTVETFTGVRCTRFEGNKIIMSVLLDSQFTFLILYRYEFLFKLVLWLSDDTPYFQSGVYIHLSWIFYRQFVKRLNIHWKIKKSFVKNGNISRYVPLFFCSGTEARTPPKTIYKSKWFIASKIGSSSRNFRNSHVSRRTSAFARGEHKDVFVPIPTTPIHSILLGTFLISMSRQIRRFLVVCIWYIT